jgi:predicted ArsR family transcriptional regulator
MDITPNASIPLLDQVKMQAQVLVPLLRALRAELGEARANALVTNALRDWSRRLFREIAAQTPGTPVERWRTMVFAMLPRLADAVDVQMLKQDTGAVEFNVTGCRFAEFFHQLGEPELGAVLLCESDVHIAAAAEGEVELTRTHTIMKGATHCDFRYRLKAGPDAS